MSFAQDCVEVGGTCLNDIPVVSIEQNVVGDVELQLRNRGNQDVLDLTQFGLATDPEFEEGGSSLSSSNPDDRTTGVFITVKEMPDDRNNHMTFWAKIKDAAGGLVVLPMTMARTAFAGIFTAEALVVDSNEVKRKRLQFFLEIEPSLDFIMSQGPLTIAEVRMSMRDVCPESNDLIDELDFTRREIALMMRRCVQYWNEIPPPIITFTPANFPFPYHYTIGIIAELHRMAELHKRRNYLNYSAGGVKIDDDDWKRYEDTGERLRKEWQDWVRTKKIEINVDGGFQSLGSPYQNTGFSR